MADDLVIDTLRRLAETLQPGDLDHTLGRITAAAVEVLPGVHYASITVKHGDGTLATAAPTDDLLLGIDAAQYELQEGPCYEAASDHTYVTSPHLAADERFPRYAPLAVAAGIRAPAGGPPLRAPEQHAPGGPKPPSPAPGGLSP